MSFVRTVNPNGGVVYRRVVDIAAKANKNHEPYKSQV